MQRKRLRTIIKHAYENVPFYHRKFDMVGIKPDDVKSVEDLAKVPITTKTQVQEASLDSFIARNVNLNICVKRATSGSTGIPLTLVASRSAIDFELALTFRTYLEDGMKPWHKMARFTEQRNMQLRQHWLQRLGLIRIKYVSVFENIEKQFSIVRELKPDVIRGYSSCLELLARFCDDHGERVKTQTVFTGAELLDKGAREIINSVFGTELFDLYVSMEFGLISWECEAHAGYHINADSLVVEFIKNGESVRPGEKGSIVITSLFNPAMPLIRYNIGDVGIPSDESCSCGRTLPLMQLVEGRTGDYLTTLDGRIISPTVFFPYPFEDVTWIKQFRVIQENREKILFQIITKDGFKPVEDHLEAAKAKMKQLFGENMDISFQVVEKMQANSSGKLRKIVSHVPVNFNQTPVK